MAKSKRRRSSQGGYLRERDSLNRGQKGKIVFHITETVCSSLKAWTKFRGELGQEMGIQTGESPKGTHRQNVIKVSDVIKLYFS